jgi:hypothetical protein
MNHMDKKPPAVEAGGEAGGNENDQYTVDPRPPWEIAQALIERGLRPVPVEHRDKKPRHKDWPRRRFSAGNFQFNDSVGLVLGDVVAVDIDITDEALAGQVVVLALKVFGPSSIRIGQWPKLVLFYRSAVVMKKTKTRSTPAGMVEVLADGQQVVVHGIHKHTGEPYKWRGAPPWSPEFKLVTITPEAVEGFLVDVEALLGLEPVETRSSEQEAAPSPPLQADQQHHDAETRAQDVERALGEYWDADSYDDWHKAALALAHYPQGRALWLAWSATSSKHTDAEASAKWLEILSSARGDISPASIMAKVPADVLQEWGREHRIASLATDPQVAEGAAIAKAILPSLQGAPEADDADAHHDDHEADEAAHGPPLGRVEASCPPHLLAVPGVLQQVVQFFNDTAIKPQPQFATMSALALGAVCLGQRWKTNRGNFAHHYSVAVARTGSGKENVRRTIERILEAAQLQELIGPAGYHSESAVISALVSQPCHIAIIDELGLLLAESKASGMGHKASMLKCLLSVFNIGDGTLRNAAFSQAGLTEGQKKLLRQVVSSPSLTLVGMSTPSTLLAALNNADIESGLVNRILFIQSDEPLQLSRTVSRAEVPEGVIAWAKFHAKAQGGDSLVTAGNGPELPPKPIEVPFSLEADKVIKAFEEELLAIVKRDTSAEELLSRCRDISMRLALILARSLEQDHIEAEAAQWAVDYTRFHFMRLLALAPRMGQGRFATVVDDVWREIKAAGRRGVTEREVARKVHALRNMPPGERRKVFEALQLDRDVKLTTFKGKGPTRMAWVAAA